MKPYAWGYIPETLRFDNLMLCQVKGESCARLIANINEKDSTITTLNNFIDVQPIKRCRILNIEQQQDYYLSRKNNPSLDDLFDTSIFSMECKLIYSRNDIKIKIYEFIQKNDSSSSSIYKIEIFEQANNWHPNVRYANYKPSMTLTTVTVGERMNAIRNASGDDVKLKVIEFIFNISLGDRFCINDIFKSSSWQIGMITDVYLDSLSFTYQMLNKKNKPMHSKHPLEWIISLNKYQPQIKHVF